MAFLDRDYYRDDGGHPFVAWLRRGLITKILVLVSILVYILQIQIYNDSGSVVTESLSLIGIRVLRGEVWRLFTFSFLHPISDLRPFLIELPLFWVAGHALEERLGRVKYGAFLAAAAVAA